MRKSLKRSFTILSILAIILVLSSFGYVYSRFHDIGLLENLTFYSGYLLCFMLVFFFIRLYILGRSFTFWKKFSFRLLSFAVIFIAISSFIIVTDRTQGAMQVVSQLDRNGSDYSFTIKDRETSYFNMDAIASTYQEQLPQTLIVPAEMVEQYEEDMQYVATYFYIDLGSLGFYYRITEFS